MAGIQNLEEFEHTHVFLNLSLTPENVNIGKNVHGNNVHEKNVHGKMVHPKMKKTEKNVHRK